MQQDIDAQRGGQLYTGILRGGSFLRMLLLRSPDPFAGTLMTTLVDRAEAGVDQPWAEAKTIKGGKASEDRPFFGNNDFNAPNGRTASIETSLDAGTAAPPAGLSTTRLELRSTAGQDMPPIRVSPGAPAFARAEFPRELRLAGHPSAVSRPAIR